MRVTTLMWISLLVATPAWAPVSAAWAGEPAGRKGEVVELRCVKEGEFMRCETPEETKKAEKPASKDELDAAFRKGFEHAMKKAQQMWMEYSNAQLYRWERPVVQEVWMPPQIVNGVFIPGHHEPVLLRPGEWKLKKAEEETK